MEKVIKNKLSEIERVNDIKVLFSCESGSRAWGFSSLDSDYDVRFIYVQRTNSYLSVADVKEDIQFPILDDLDVYGWDIRKVLRLLLKSNVTPFEWIQSPIVYAHNAAFVKTLKEVLEKYYSTRNHSNHYLGLVKGRLEQMADPSMKLKSFFYILRSLLSAKWNLTFNHYAPMELDPLLDLLPTEFRAEVERLRKIKAEVDESYMFEPNTSFKTYFEKEYQTLYEKNKDLVNEHRDTATLDNFFRKILN